MTLTRKIIKWIQISNRGKRRPFINRGLAVYGPTAHLSLLFILLYCNVTLCWRYHRALTTTMDCTRESIVRGKRCLFLPLLSREAWSVVYHLCWVCGTYSTAHRCSLWVMVIVSFYELAMDHNGQLFPSPPRKTGLGQCLCTLGLRCSILSFWYFFCISNCVTDALNLQNRLKKRGNTAICAFPASLCTTLEKNCII